MSKKYDFETYNKEKRIQSDLIKWKISPENETVIPMWVADMDFETLPNIADAIKKRADTGLFGYTEQSPGYKNAIIKWYKNRHGFDIDESWIINCLGVVFGYSQAILAMTKMDDAILIMPPVYNEFFAAIKAGGRKIVESELMNNNGRFEINFEDFEKKIIDNSIKLFLMCSPHNPVGRVWTEDELRQISKICNKHGVFVISDEIHSDLVFANHKHIPYLKIDESNGKNSIICTAASKTFNLAGFQSSYMIVQDEDIRKKIETELRKIGYGDVSAFGTLATETAYSHGGDWADQLIDTIEENYNYVKSKLETECPKIKCNISEGTYLLWLDCREFGLSEDELFDFFHDEAQVWLNKGRIYGDCADGYLRMNIGCPKSIVEKAISQIIIAYDKRGW